MWLAWGSEAGEAGWEGQTRPGLNKRSWKVPESTDFRLSWARGPQLQRFNSAVTMQKEP